MELVKFDMQQMDNPEISGVEYQQGTLAGYEMREYLLEKWGRHCVYCGAKDVPLEIEHINPRSRSQDDRVCNLTLSCEPCNKKKGSQDIRDFLKHKPDLLQKILAQAKAPLKDAAAVNVTRWALCRRLQALGLPVECGSGGLTKYNRTLRGLPKAHWIDAACVGESTPAMLKVQGVIPLLITAQGHGCRQVTNVDRYGFPKGKPKQGGRVKGFRTGDMVKAVVRTGTKKGTYTGRVLVRARGSFDIVTKTARVTDISYKYCRLVQRTEGYRYALGTPISLSNYKGLPPLCLRAPRGSRVSTASTVCTKNPRPPSLPICLNKADLVPMGQIDVGRILPQENHARAMSLFPALVQVRLHQGRTRDIGLDLRNRYKALACFQVCM